MTTTALQWNSLTLCNPSDGLSVYGLTGLQGASLAFEDVTFLGASGRMQRAMGARINDATSRQASFTGLVFAASSSTLLSLVTSVEAKMVDYTQAVGQLTFAVPFTASSTAWSNMRCTEFKPAAVAFLENPIVNLPGLDLPWVMGFNATFIEVAGS